MSEGQLYTSSERCVDDGLEGVVAANSGFVLLPEQVGGLFYSRCVGQLQLAPSGRDFCRALLVF